LQACTHPSILVPHKALKVPGPEPATNGDLAALGNALLGMFVAEYVHAAYPHLPTRVMKAAVSAYAGTTTCAALARDIGATPLFRWHRTVSVCACFLST
jgi:large subunit ribosomal protein L44